MFNIPFKLDISKNIKKKKIIKLSSKNRLNIETSVEHDEKISGFLILIQLTKIYLNM